MNDDYSGHRFGVFGPERNTAPPHLRLISQKHNPNAASPPSTEAATYSTANHGALSHSSPVSSEMAEKVVKPPSSPVTSDSRATPETLSLSGEYRRCTYGSRTALILKDYRVNIARIEKIETNATTYIAYFISFKVLTHSLFNIASSESFLASLSAFKCSTKTNSYEVN